MRHHHDDEERLPEGFVCRCGETIKFSPWVYAHWVDRVTYECKRCGAVTVVTGGAPVGRTPVRAVAPEMVLQ